MPVPATDTVTPRASIKLNEPESRIRGVETALPLIVPEIVAPADEDGPTGDENVPSPPHAATTKAVSTQARKVRKYRGTIIASSRGRESALVRQGSFL
jgi:hypothetical protein